MSAEPVDAVDLPDEVPEPDASLRQASEVAIIDATPDTVTLSTGMVVELEQLRARQFFRMLRIVTRGAGPLLMEYPLDTADENELLVRLSTLLVMSIPEAEDETIDFIKSMCRPADLETSTDKAALARNERRMVALANELDNPDPMDLVNLVEAVIRRESGDLQALGKRVSALFTLARRTGQVPEAKASPSEPGKSTDGARPPSSPKAGSRRSRATSSSAD